MLNLTLIHGKGEEGAIKTANLSVRVAAVKRRIRIRSEHSVVDSQRDIKITETNYFAKLYQRMIQRQ